MKSKTVKAAVLAYYRFQRGFFVSTETEVGSKIADVLAISKDYKQSVEIEVKVSKSDLKNEWSNKAQKHQRLQEDNNRAGKANYFYFAMPASLYDEALQESINLNGHDSYGVMTVDENFQLTIVKQAKRLNTSKNDKLAYRLFLRATSELTNIYLRDHRLDS